MPRVRRYIMIKYNPKIWFGHIFLFHKSETLRILFPEIIIMALYTAGLTYLELHYFKDVSVFKNTISVHSLVGLVLGLLLVFRTNSAYDRWWEGRKHWGALVNNTRNLATKIKTLVPAQQTEVYAFFQKMIPNYAFAMKEHLRDNKQLQELEDVDGLLATLEQTEHVPNHIALKMYQKAKELQANGTITNEEFLMLDKELKSFSDIVGACERIKNTPIPFSYSLFMKKFIFLYIITLPIGFIPTFGYWSIPISVFIFYVLVSLEVIAEEIEDPFGTDANDLPTQGLSEKIKANVKEILEA